MSETTLGGGGDGGGGGEEHCGGEALHDSTCSTLSWIDFSPLNSFTARRYAARRGEGSGSSAPKRIASRRRPSLLSSSLRCRSPTTRWLSTANVSQKSGCGKAWPQMPSSSMRATSSV